MSRPDFKIFKEGIIPSEDAMPAEQTHERTKLIYRVLKAVAFMKPNKRQFALLELQEINKTLWDRVVCYLSRVTQDEIEFVRGPRPHFYEDGKLAIYHPIKDNPLLMAVYEGEKPLDGKRRLIVTPN
jgi:hypothetical protein